ncbi:MAG: hypothetical protein M5R38_14575, partial [Candidatus Methylomirabilis sp.]|nr:hypothetical protein [Candidatus Methylomirabilis sp.]
MVRRGGDVGVQERLAGKEEQMKRWRQTFIPGRSGRLLDIEIDAVGTGPRQVLSGNGVKRLFDLTVSGVGLLASLAAVGQWSPQSAGVLCPSCWVN